MSSGNRFSAPGAAPADAGVVMDVEDSGAARSSGSRKVTTWRIATLVLILVAWQLASGRAIPEYVVSNPLAVGQRLATWISDGTLWFHLAITLEATLWGFLIGGSVAVVIGVGLGWLRQTSAVLEPFLMALYGLPKIALAPLFILWFGIGLSMKIALVAAIVFFLVLWNAFAGVRAVDRELLDIVRVMGAKRWMVLRKVVIPSALEWIYLGLKVAVPYAIVGAVTGELLASNRGVGFLLMKAAGEFDPAGLFASLVVLMILASSLNALLSRSERLVLRWKTNVVREEQ